MEKARFDRSLGRLEHFNREDGITRTTGCGCCSCDLDNKTDKEKVIGGAINNLETVLQISAFYHISLSRLVKAARQQTVEKGEV